MASFLNVSGTKIVDGDGNEVILCGAGLGGWMKCVPLHGAQVKSLSSSLQHGEFYLRLPRMRVPDPRCSRGRYRTRKVRILFRQGLRTQPPFSWFR